MFNRSSHDLAMLGEVIGNRNELKDFIRQLGVPGSWTLCKRYESLVYDSDSDNEGFCFRLTNNNKFIISGDRSWVSVLKEMFLQPNLQDKLKDLISFDPDIEKEPICNPEEEKAEDPIEDFFKLPPPQKSKVTHKRYNRKPPRSVYEDWLF
ncbi:hypothetical protein [Leptospira broomii]|nr:hypothetical protein [Leptospira broomii]